MPRLAHPLAPFLLIVALAVSSISATETAGTGLNDLVIYDPERKHVLSAETHHMNVDYSCYEGMEVQGNPWGVGADARTEWSEGLDVPRIADVDREVEYLLWVGCAGATDPRARKTQQALVKILKAAGVDFAVLGPEETCTGDVARRAGNEFLFQMMAEQNIETFNNYGVKKIVTFCPHCYHTLKNEYPQFGGEYEWNEKGGIIHWTHHDPAGRHADGWLKHNNRIYQ